MKNLNVKDLRAREHRPAIQWPAVSIKYDFNNVNLLRHHTSTNRIIVVPWGVLAASFWQATYRFSPRSSLTLLIIFSAMLYIEMCWNLCGEKWELLSEVVMKRLDETRYSMVLYRRNVTWCRMLPMFLSVFGVRNIWLFWKTSTAMLLSIKRRSLLHLVVKINELELFEGNLLGTDTENFIHFLRKCEKQRSSKFRSGNTHSRFFRHTVVSQEVWNSRRNVESITYVISLFVW